MPDTSSTTMQIDIEQIVPGGLGLGRSDGRVVLVPLTAPGDQCTVQVAPGETTGRLLQVINPGPARIEPRCPHFGVCGGCDFMHLDYNAQIQAKAAMIEDALRRIGRFHEWPAVSVMPSSEPFGSRIRAVWRPSPDGGAGYFRRESNEVIDIDVCPILEPGLEARRRLLSPRSAIRALTNGKDISLDLEDSDAGQITFVLGQNRYQARSDVFFQANGAVLEPFVECVIAAANPSKEQSVHDLFCGLGLFSIPLARLAATVDGIDGDEEAVLLGIENARGNSLTNCAFHAMTVENWLRHSPIGDIIIIDPPRAGLSKSAASMLPGKVKSRLVYVSCDPVTFARDASRLVERGMRFTSLTAFDMFPQTHHVELVATFEKSKRSQRRRG
jgi:23S rRNA (uracil1939-C5)-methyltransferase